MCGIAGAIFPNGTPAERWNLARRLLLELTVRGEDAAGIGFHRNGQPVVVKEAGSAKTFVRTEAFKSLEEDLPETFIVHTRKTTKGSEKNNINNHPVMSKMTGAILVHNGVIDDELFRRTDDSGDNPYMWQMCDGQVDSEAILRAIETLRHYPRHEDMSVDVDRLTSTPKEQWTPQVSWLRAIDDAATNLEGTFACALLVPEEKDALYLFRSQDRPIFVAYIPEWDAVVFASTEDILCKAITTVDVDYIFGVFPSKVYNTPDYHGLHIVDDCLWRVVRAGEQAYDVQQFDLDVPKWSTSFTSTPRGTSAPTSGSGAGSSLSGRHSQQQSFRNFDD
jgi:glucosamine 6-phosphate synthetase-like amidotransferase/phosphosugar isomerase protein